jgi:hypothetical protein
MRDEHALQEHLRSTLRDAELAALQETLRTAEAQLEELVVLRAERDAARADVEVLLRRERQLMQDVADLRALLEQRGRLLVRLRARLSAAARRRP